MRVEDQDEVVVDHPVAIPVDLGNIRSVQVDHHGERMGVLPIVHIHDGTGVVKPFDLRNRVGVVARFAAGEETTTVQHRMFQTQMNELGDERKKLFLVLVEIPIGPRNLIILAVRVIVALLGAGHFVATADHRNALA